MNEVIYYMAMVAVFAAGIAFLIMICLVIEYVIQARRISYLIYKRDRLDLTTMRGQIEKKMYNAEIDKFYGRSGGS